MIFKQPAAMHICLAEKSALWEEKKKNLRQEADLQSKPIIHLQGETWWTFNEYSDFWLCIQLTLTAPPTQSTAAHCWWDGWKKTPTLLLHLQERQIQTHKQKQTLLVCKADECWMTNKQVAQLIK